MTSPKSKSKHSCETPRYTPIPKFSLSTLTLDMINEETCDYPLSPKTKLVFNSQGARIVDLLPFDCKEELKRDPTLSDKILQMKHERREHQRASLNSYPSSLKFSRNIHLPILQIKCFYMSLRLLMKQKQWRRLLLNEPLKKLSSPLIEWLKWFCFI